MTIQKYISTEEAYKRDFVLQSPITISGPKDKMTDENMNQCIVAVSEFFIARSNNFSHLRRLREELGIQSEVSDLSTLTRETDEDDVYVRMARKSVRTI